MKVFPYFIQFIKNCKTSNVGDIEFDEKLDDKILNL